MTAIFLYLLGLFVAFALLNVLLHREVRSERRRRREAARAGAADMPRAENREPATEPEGQRDATGTGQRRPTS